MPLQKNERYVIVEDERKLTYDPQDHPRSVHVFLGNYSPNYGYKNHTKMGSFLSRADAQKWIEENK